MTLRIAMLSTYPPTQCGIATFARSLSEALLAAGQDVNIVNLGNPARTNGNPMVLASHHAESDLPRTSHAVNGHDVAILQHEFGIFGGPDGSEVLDILANIAIPVVTVMHTVIERPTEQQRRVTQGLLNGSDRVVTLSKSALRVLLRSYDVDLQRTHVIPHGAPKLGTIPRSNQTNLRPRILTWGLLGEGKGIEWGIEALDHLRDVDPAPDYFVVGQTHPKVLERDGERYRKHLQTLAIRKGLSERVRFIDGYLDSRALARVINQADIYLLPYDTTDQVTSGVLAEAMVAGGPIVATRFPHATELLNDGSGFLVQQGDPSNMADALRRLIRQPELRLRMRALTEQKAKSFHWPAVGLAFNRLIHSTWRNRQGVHQPVAAKVSARIESAVIPA